MTNLHNHYECKKLGSFFPYLFTDNTGHLISLDALLARKKGVDFVVLGSEVSELAARSLTVWYSCTDRGASIRYNSSFADEQQVVIWRGLAGLAIENGNLKYVAGYRAVAARHYVRPLAHYG